ncbi:hypothetical protein C1H46_015495 [Malus baccata]|uniref:Uncharacterized protein n=1 Tax=Malus baccata TaxID=106549 RepID=A0A540MKX4_MALBA|nr:hypothetical protein C1H46_015495 [Malus baccata]
MTPAVYVELKGDNNDNVRFDVILPPSRYIMFSSVTFTDDRGCMATVTATPWRRVFPVRDTIAVTSGQ